MKLYLNGNEHEANEGETLPSLLESLGFADRPVLVEHNGEALHQREYAAATLADGDQLEIIQIVAGG